MDIENLPARSSDGNVYVFVEIPKGSMNKYEYDKDLGVIALDRTLYSAVHYPTAYGFIPGTRSEDGELLDAMVMLEVNVFPGCLVETRLLGSLTISHAHGMLEHKLLSVPVRDPRFAEYHDIGDLPSHLLKEIENFFDVFKELEGRDLGVGDWEDAREAGRVLDAAIEAHKTG